MKVPKCKECDHYYRAYIGTVRSPNYCKPSINEHRLSKMIQITSREMGKTSPKWCPIRVSRGN